MGFVNVERHGHVAVVELNRPERRNALGTGMLDALVEAVQELDADGDVHVIMFAAAGPGFCAGADLKEFSGDDQEAVLRLNIRTGAFIRSFSLIDTPVIAAVHGFAMGGGLMLAAACDVVVSSADTRWGLPEVSLGWLPGLGLQALATRIGVFNARRLTWGAEPLHAQEAYRMGLIDIMVPSIAEIRQRATDYAHALAALPPHAVTSAKRFFAEAAASGAEAADIRANKSYRGDVAHPHAQESMQRFRPGSAR